MESFCIFPVREILLVKSRAIKASEVGLDAKYSEKTSKCQLKKLKNMVNELA